MRFETEMMRKRLNEAGLIGKRPVWYIWRIGSWAFVCGMCGRPSYYPQNVRTVIDGHRQVYIGYRYCPYCRTEIKAIRVCGPRKTGGAKDAGSE